MVYVYAIRSIHRNYTYVGQSENIIRRFHEHNNGEEKITKPYAPYILILSLECIDRKEARKWEKFYKTGRGRARLKSLMFG
jgi:putative endonuclease